MRTPLCRILAGPTTLFGVGLAGVILVVRRLQVGDGQMQVTLGGGQGPVTHDFLNVPEIGLILHQMRGDGVPPDVAGDVLFDARLLHIFFDGTGQRVLAHLPLADGEEQAVALPLAYQFGANALDVVFQERASQFGQWHDAVFGSLAAIDSQQAFLDVHVLNGQVHQFAFADASGVKHFQHGAVAVADHGLQVGLLHNLAGLLNGQHVPGQVVRFAGITHVFDGIAGQIVFLGQKCKEAFERAQAAVLRAGRARRAPMRGLHQQPRKKIVHRRGADGLQVGHLRFHQVAFELAQCAPVGFDGAGSEVEQLQVLQVAVGQYVVMR